MLRLQSFFKFIGIFLFLNSLSAEISLPLHTVRDQSSTRHCWSYAMSHLLETRSLYAHKVEATINIEQDVVYWVNLERLMSIFDQKKDMIQWNPLYDEGGWQIEYWNSFLKYGKLITASKADVIPQVVYSPFFTYYSDNPFVTIERPSPVADLLSFEELKEKLIGNEFPTREEAFAYVRTWLDGQYGKPFLTTQWMGEEIATQEVPKKILASDFEVMKNTESMVLIKPVSDLGQGWVKYLGERYWGYRYEQGKIFGLIQQVLDKGWPVTYDNVYHAITIIAYKKNEETGKTHYAIADSAPASIYWQDEERLLGDLNLVTVPLHTVSDLLPAREGARLLLPLPRAESWDEVDNVIVPPR